MQASLIIPAHNEEDRLCSTLATYEKVMRERYGSDFEIVTVINGSSDNSTQLALEARAVSPQIKVVEVEDRVGKGGAVLEGFLRANSDRLAFADADGATAPRSLLELLTQLDRYDIVIGSRRLKDSVIVKRQPLVRRVFGWAFVRLVRLLFGLPFKDTQCGAKALRRAAALRLARVIRYTHWTFDLDLLLWANRFGFRFKEHPVEWADEKGSQLRYAMTTFEVLQTLWALKLQQYEPLPESGEPPLRGTELETAPEMTTSAGRWRALAESCLDAPVKWYASHRTRMSMAESKDRQLG